MEMNVKDPDGAEKELGTVDLQPLLQLWLTRYFEPLTAEDVIDRRSRRRVEFESLDFNRHFLTTVPSDHDPIRVGDFDPRAVEGRPDRITNPGADNLPFGKIRRDPQDHQAHYYLALTEFLQGKLLEAEADGRRNSELLSTAGSILSPE